MQQTVSRFAGALVLAVSLFAPLTAGAQTGMQNPGSQAAAADSAAAAYFAAMVSGNGPSFIALTTPDFKFTSPDGTTMNADDLLTSVGENRAMLDSSGVTEERARVWVESVNATGPDTLTATVKSVGTFDVPAGGRFADLETVDRERTHTLTLQKDAAGNWKVAADKLIARSTEQ